MFEKYSTGRIGVFIDEANLFHSQKTLGWRIDYQKLFLILYELNLGLRNIFLGYIQENTKQINFHLKLIAYGYIVHSKKVKEIKDKNRSTNRKGNLDAELALDAFQFNDIYDTLILFSGDSDFSYLIDILKERNKKIIIVSTKDHVSIELLKRGKFIEINKLRNLIEFI